MSSYKKALFAFGVAAALCATSSSSFAQLGLPKVGGSAPAPQGGVDASVSQDQLVKTYVAADSEALLVEAAIASDAEYWSIQLMDTFYNALDFRARQSSLNGTFAAADADGTVRICVSQRDPGVQNWLDMSGHYRVGLRLRVVQPQRPVIRSRVVDLAEIPRSVGEGPVAAELDRAAMLRRRSWALQRRRRW